MLQRKGKFVPCHIKMVDEAGAFELQKLFVSYWDHMKKLWEPISDPVESIVDFNWYPTKPSCNNSNAKNIRIN